jgi:UDPglucose 6-dehydrogenase
MSVVILLGKAGETVVDARRNNDRSAVGSVAPLVRRLRGGSTPRAGGKTTGTMVREERTRIGVFGAGYVGLVTGACLAELGRTVIVCETDAEKLATLNAGRLPLYEPGLDELVERGVREGRLAFTSDAAETVRGARAAFIAVGTPMAENGSADLRFVRAAACSIGRHLDGPTVIVNKSTVPVETGDLVSALIGGCRVAPYHAVVVSNPEFLREGTAVHDFFHPDRIVIGCSDPLGEAVLRDLYAPLNAPFIVTDVHTAEMIKYTANAFLAAKISFANEIAAICERVGADVKTVMAGAGADKRIGTAFLGAGLGFGGSCLPKDVSALRRIAQDAAIEPVLLDAILEINARQIERVVSLIAYRLGGISRKRIGLLGMAFKAGTDDVRESPAIALAEALLAGGARLCVHDPAAMDRARERLGERVSWAPADDPSAVAAEADALVLATAWDDYQRLDFTRFAALMRRRVVVDTRNVLDGAALARAGFNYTGIGRASPRPLLVGDSDVA